jgi:hypothetical protein
MLLVGAFSPRSAPVSGITIMIVKNDVVVPPVVPFAPPEFHFLIEVLVECGWPRPAAFEVAVFLKLCGMPAHLTVQVLTACSRWRQ